MHHVTFVPEITMLSKSYAPTRKTDKEKSSISSASIVSMNDVLGARWGVTGCVVLSLALQGYILNSKKPDKAQSSGSFKSQETSGSKNNLMYTSYLCSTKDPVNLPISRKCYSFIKHLWISLLNRKHPRGGILCSLWRQPEQTVPCQTNAHSDLVLRAIIQCKKDDMC